jgi:hypothetical protein
VSAQTVAMSSSNKSKVDLRLDWCSYKAAKYACEKWHYSGCVPAGKLVKVGVWEDGKFIGVVLFSWGANRNIGSPYGLAMTQVCELVRVALGQHQAPVSRILRVAMALLQKQSPGVVLIVSYADQNQDHHGGIYQAGNWAYVGVGVGTHQLLLSTGEMVHKRVAWARFGTNDSAKIPGSKYVYPESKHKYLYPLTPEMRAKIEPLRKPYPKRASNKGNHPDQGQGGGAVPT